MNRIPAMIGRYHVERLLGEGGMGVLYLARDPVIDRHVALKLLRVNGEDLRRRFMREAQSAGRLQHPNIVTVYDVGDHEGQLYIAMEYIDGDTLAALIRQDVPFSPIRKLDIMDEIADGLGYAHDRGIVHRDIKPANLMITRAGLVKVLDFGIARLTHRESAEIDQSTLIGTPAYMAPEHLEGEEVDARSDIYAVGLVMYELFSGQRAFVGATTADVLQQVLDARPTPLEHLVPELDPDLARVVTRAMARQPADRYQTLQAMRKDLARARRRALQDGADDATIVVGPATAPGITRDTLGLPSPSVRATLPPTGSSVPSPPATAIPVAGTSPQTTATVIRPTAPAEAAAASAGTSPVPDSPPPAAGGLPLPALPPLPTVPPRTETGPVPVPLPAVPSSAFQPSPEAGRSTVDAPVVPVVGDGTGSSSPRPPAAAAPPPVAPPGAVHTPAPLVSPPSQRRSGVPAPVIVVGLIALLAFVALGAFLVVRTLGTLGTGSLSGLFTRTVEPRITGPADTQPPPSGPDAGPPAADPVPPTDPGTDVPVEVAEATPEAARALPETPAETPAPPPAPPATTTATTRPAAPRAPAGEPGARASTARATPPPEPRGSIASRPTSPASRATVEDAPPAVVAANPPSRPIERREPDPPAPVAPQDEGTALVRAYVAARNTAHASGIRRVWPDVDDNHLRRITSAFSAPLTLGGCDIEARDATHATATCRLTQAGTTGTYASGQALTIRRTFVFDLVRQGRAWVIAGMRE